MRNTKAQEAEKRAIGAWFREQRQAQGVSSKAAEQILGISRQGVSNMEKVGMTYRAAVERAGKLGWEIPDLPDLLEGVPAENAEYLTLTSITPSMGWGACSDSEVLTRVDISRDQLSLMVGEVSTKNLGLCTAKGDSMSPTIRNRDTLIVDTSVREFDGSDGIYVFTNNGFTYLKRIRVLQSGVVQIISDNREEFPIEEISRETLADITVHARVVGRWNYQIL